MKKLVIKENRKWNNGVVFDVFTKVPNKQREITNQELDIYINEDGTLQIRLMPKTYPAFLCLNCHKVEYHNNGNGHIYPLCSECANTETIFNHYFTYKENDYYLRIQFHPKIDGEHL